MNTTTNALANIPKFFAENITLAYKDTLGCGACIRGGYIYCIPGAEGSDPSSWGTNKAVCCKNSTVCPQLTNKNFTCSNTYTDKSLAKAMCPFRRGAGGCGSVSQFNFTNAGDSQKVNLTIPLGETCTFQIQADCGLPTVAPNDTTGFEIEMIDFDDDDLAKVEGNKTGNGGDRKPPRNFNLANSTIQAAKFNPLTDSGKREFKGGKGDSQRCKKRYQQVSVTALGNLTSQAARLLQSSSSSSPSSYSIELTVSSTDTSSSSSSAFSLVSGVLSLSLVLIGSLLF